MGKGGGSRPQFLKVSVYFLHATYIWAIISLSDSEIFFQPRSTEVLLQQPALTIYLHNQLHVEIERKKANEKQREKERQIETYRDKQTE